ncbi:hypothetical protein SRHO_G00239370 [Serrasalmus rhombeus]
MVLSVWSLHVLPVSAWIYSNIPKTCTQANWTCFLFEGLLSQNLTHSSHTLFGLLGHLFSHQSLCARSTTTSMYTSGVFLVLLLHVGSAAAALADGGLCYILDGILVIYGIILTVLYCRLRMRGNSGNQTEEKQGEGIYQGLKPHAQDTYETLNVKKKKGLA